MKSIMNKFINQILAKVRNDDPITSFQASDRLDFIGEHLLPNGIFVKE
jgi:hypothetical protein